MNKYFSGLLAGFTVGAVLAGSAYTVGYITLKQKYTEQFAPAKISGFKLYVDGVVIDHLAIDKVIDFKRVYFHGMPWKLYASTPDYINILRATVQPENLFNTKLQWPFESNIPLVIEKLAFNKIILGNSLAFTGSAKQNPETPLLVEFKSATPQLDLEGQAEIRIKDHFLETADIEFKESSSDLPLIQTKRMSGWASYSFDQEWQIVGEIDAGFTKLVSREFSDATLKLNGPVRATEITFLGNENADPVIISKMEDVVNVQKKERIFPVHIDNNSPLLTQIIHTFDKIDQLPVVEEKKIEIAVKEEPKKIEQKKPVEKAPEPKAEPEQILKLASEPEKAETPETPETPEQTVQEKPLEPVVFPAVRLESLTGNSDLRGFYYNQTVTPVPYDCPESNCWIAQGLAGEFTYDPDNLPNYFLKIKNYQELTQLKSALLKFTVESITVQGKGQHATEINLKGMTTNGQSAEIQLSVLALE